MTSRSPRPARLLLAPLVRAVPAVGLMLLLWHHFDTFAADSADIGGGPLGLVLAGAFAALVAAVDGRRLGRAAATRLWFRTCAWVALLLLAASLLLTSSETPGELAQDVALRAVIVVVASGVFGLLPLLGLVVGSSVRRPRAR